MFRRVVVVSRTFCVCWAEEPRAGTGLDSAVRKHGAGEALAGAVAGRLRRRILGW